MRQLHFEVFAGVRQASVTFTGIWRMPRVYVFERKVW